MTQTNIVPTRSKPPPSYPMYRFVSSLRTYVPIAQLITKCLLSDAARKVGVNLLGGPGSGKSRLLGRFLAWQDLWGNKPVVILDPIGGTIDNFLDHLPRVPVSWRKDLARRIRYVDVGATDYLVPTPLYYRLSETDSLYEIANRYPIIIRRQDPDLQSAPILGWNPLHECAIHAGKIAAALNRQLDFVAALVKTPKLFKEDLKTALERFPELDSSVAYFRELMDPTSSLRERRTGSFQTHLLPFVADPLNMARYASSRGAIDWEAVVRNRQTVLIDFRTVRDPDQRQFAMLWWVKSFTDFIKHRGMTGRGQEVTFIIDEITQLLGHRTREKTSILEEDINELTTVLGRNYGVNVVISHQNLGQVSEGIVNSLAQMGTQIVGVLARHEDAMTIAQDMTIYDPYWVKKIEPIWAVLPESSAWYLNPSGTHADGTPYNPFSTRPLRVTIGYRTIEFSINEQDRMAADKFKVLDRFQFLVKRVRGEGRGGEALRLVSLARYDPGQYPNAEYLAHIRACLRQVGGVPVEDVLKELEQRKPPQYELPKRMLEQPKRIKGERKAVPTNGKIAEPPVNAERNHTVPSAAHAPTPSPTTNHLPPAPPATDEIRSDDDDVWQ